MSDRVLVQAADFSVAEEYAWLTDNNAADGAVVNFVGRLRDMNEGVGVQGLFLEHYPGMTEQVLSEWVAEARRRWDLGRVSVIHRVGELRPADQIVWVGVTSAHRANAFAAAEFLMDQLKTTAPFWKKEHTVHGDRWVAPRSSDDNRAARWLPQPFIRHSFGDVDL